MAAYSQITTAVNGNTITADVWNNEFSAVAASVNSVTNAQIASGAGIAYSKLALTGAILNADLAGSIASSKINGTAVTLAGVETLTNKTLTTPALTNPTVSGSTQTVTTDNTGNFDVANTNVFIRTLDGTNGTLGIDNVATGKVFFIILIQDGSGNHTVSWFTTIKWASGGTAPTLTSTAGRRDIFSFLYDGTVYNGQIVGQNYA